MAEQLEKAHIAHELGPQDDRPAGAGGPGCRRTAAAWPRTACRRADQSATRSSTAATTSPPPQFEQTINQTRALEGELSRSIRLISGVRAARVHLVLPHREPFASEQVAAQASVLLSIGRCRPDGSGRGAGGPEPGAAAVPGLKPQNIALIDNRGNVLARAGNPVDGGSARSVDELRQATELRLARAGRGDA